MKKLRRKLSHFRPSWRAILFLWREEYSFKVLVIYGGITLFLSLVFHISTIEFLFVVLTIGVVLAVEALNTGLEELCDHVTPEEHPKIGVVKDIASGATLLVLIAAFLIGCIIFIPRVTVLL